MICSIYNQQPKQNSSLLSYHDSEEGQVQVQLAFASLYLDLAFVDLSGVGGGPPRATPAEVVQVNLKDFNLTSTTSARVGEVHLGYCVIYIKELPRIGQFFKFTLFGAPFLPSWVPIALCTM